MKRVQPLAGQESVWDYPRPPRLEPCSKCIKIISGGLVLLESIRAFRLLETSHPPGYYVPPEDINLDLLVRGSSSSFCEFKGEAAYFDLKSGVKSVAWFYPAPTKAFVAIKDFVAFYPARVVLQAGDGCFVDNELVTPQAGNFYGGWITKDVVGPFKGEAGTQGW
jgi:uncharacterized protein (DUF427 family)